jgi:hypothetical protein
LEICLKVYYLPFFIIYFILEFDKLTFWKIIFVI